MVIAQVSRSSHWMIRMFDFPVKQLVLTQLFLTPIIIIFVYDESILLHTVPLFVGSICVLLSLYTIWPYTTIHAKDIQSTVADSKSDSISVMSVNVFMHNSDHKRLIELVQNIDPDFLLLLETNLKWQRATEKLDATYPYQIKHPLENTYGLLFFSKYPIKNSEVRFLLKSEIPSIKAKIELSPNHTTWFYGVHPEPPSPTESETSEPRDIELLKLSKEVRQIQEPIIFAGDFNDVAWSHTTRLFRRHSGLLDPRIGRGSFSTFNAKYPLLRWPLDHFFLSPHFTINKMSVLPSIGSDHFPIMIDVNLNSNANQKSPMPEGDDIKEVQEKLANEKFHRDVR